MPYCPKCDMEFIDGITTCTDCGGSLVESKEVADEMKRKEQEELFRKQQEAYERMVAENARFLQDDALGDETVDGENGFGKDGFEGGEASDDTKQSGIGTHSKQKDTNPVRVYVSKSQKYDDLKSSASAFYLVGGAVLIFAVLWWAGIVPIPVSGTSGIISKTALTLMGIVALYVAVTSSASAKKIQSQVAAEEEATKQLTDWFLENFTAETLDAQIAAESGDLSPEEMSLKRFDLIQDIFITNHDITDQAYVDALAEDIYAKLYEEL